MLPPLLQALENRAREHPEKPAILAGAQTISRAELVLKIRQAAGILKRRGVEKGDRVILSATNSPSFVYAYAGAHLLGAVAVPLDPQTTQGRLKFIADQVEPKALFLGGSSGAEPSAAESIGVFLEETDGPEPIPPSTVTGQDLADILFTTGTTGQPKGVMLSHRNILAAAQNINAFIGNTSGDSELLPLPLSHSFGLGRLRCNLLAGGTLILADGLSDLRTLFRLFRQWRPTGFASVPAGFAILLRLAGDQLAEFAGHLRYIEIGSAPMPREQKLRLAKLLPQTRICMHYGLTEASRSTFVEFHQDLHKLDSIGRPSPNVSIRLAGSDGLEVPTGDPGEIHIQGGMVTAGYWRNPGLTASTLADGWFRTGDVATRDPDGYLHLQGRESELINTGGRKVSPIEIEEVLRTHPALEDCACAGAPDPDGIAGQVAVAYLVGRANTPRPADPALRTFFEGKLEPYKFPRSFVWVPVIPRTSSGKIQRAQLGPAGRAAA